MCHRTPLLSSGGRLGPHLQVGHSLLKGLGVLPQQPLLLQEVGIPARGGRLEQAIVEHILEALAQGTEHLLLGSPDGGIRVEAQAFLVGEAVGRSLVVWEGGGVILGTAGASGAACGGLEMGAKWGIGGYQRQRPPRVGEAPVVIL